MDRLAHDAQAEPRAVDVAARVGVGAEEALEQARPSRRRHAKAIIADRDHDLAIVRMGA